MADISKIQLENNTYDIKDTTARGDIASLNSAVNTLNNKMVIPHILKNKKAIIIGDSLDITNRWGDYFITYSGCDGENYGNGSAGFTSQGNTPPYTDMTFLDMLNYIINNKTEAQRNEVQYIIVGGGINDALNSHTPASIESAVQSFITTAKTNFINAKIIIIPLHTFKWLENIELSRYQAIIDTCKNNGVMTTDDFIFWTVDDRTYDSGDHTHLTDVGYQILAKNILSCINGTASNTIENVGFTLESDWEIQDFFNVIKKGNIVYVSGILHKKTGHPTASEQILTFDNGSYITGSSSYPKYIPAIYYQGGTDVYGTVNVNNGVMKCGRPQDYTNLSQPYVYINGCFPLGLM